jgi:DNA (cytosine-5)-methyltransferase 1
MNDPLEAQESVIEGYGPSRCSVAGALTFGSLFAGIGGIDLGFERAGLKCKWQVEIDPYARKVLAKHWPEVRRHDDVRTWPQPDTEHVDIIAGGFPCQDISYAGKGAGLAGERSGLFFEAMRIVRDMEPRYVVLENVAALLTRGLGQVLGTLASLGYDAEWDCLPASSFGASHYRNRIFIVATNANGEGLPRRSQEHRHSAEANAQQPRMPIERHGRWAVEPDVGRVAYGVSNRVDRIRGLGNAVVPQVAEYIGRRIVAASS